MVENVTPKRIWELDVLRGFAFIMMAFDHFCFDVGLIFRNLYTNPILLKICNFGYNYAFSSTKKIINCLLCWAIFMLVSGISSSLSKSNVRRGLRLLIIASIFSVITYIGSVIGVRLEYLAYGESFTVYFGILQCLSICMLLTPLLNKLKNYQLGILALVIIGAYFLTKGVYLDTMLLIPFNIRPENLSSLDYQPLLPRLGIYIIGMIIGRIVYQKRQSLFKKELNIIPLSYFGKHTLIFYFVHQIVLILILSLGILIK